MVVYSAQMQQNSALRRRLLELVASAWVVAAQIWYYSQFKEQFRSIFSLTLRRLWH